MNFQTLSSSQNLEERFSTFGLYGHHLGILIKCRFQVPSPRDSDLEELGAIAKKYTKKEIILKVSKEAILTAPVGDLQLVE